MPDEARIEKALRRLDELEALAKLLQRHGLGGVGHPERHGDKEHHPSAGGHSHTHADLTSVTANQHHAKAHGSADHSAQSDAEAIHDNVAGEIALVTEKVTPVAADLILIEDSAAANAKKRVQVGNLPGAAGGASPLTTKGDLYTYTTEDARLAVGANFTVLQSASGEATGLIWRDKPWLSGIADTGGTQRVEIANANAGLRAPHGIATATTVWARQSAGGPDDGVTAINAGYGAAPATGGTYIAARISPNMSPAAGVAIALSAVAGIADHTGRGGTSGNLLRGLEFQARTAINTSQMADTETVGYSEQTGVYTQLAWVAVLVGSGTRTHTISRAAGVFVKAPSPVISGAGITQFNVSNYVSLEADAVAISNSELAITTGYGIKIGDISGTSFTNGILMEIGPTPYLRLLSSRSWTPAANQTPLYIAEGTIPTLRQVRWKAGDALLSTDKVMVLV